MANETIEVLRIPGTLFPCGPFDENADYKFLNFVESGGNGYVCLQPCTGIPVTNTAYWFKFVFKGEKGDAFTYADLTAEQKAELVRDATAAAQAAASSAQSAADDAAAVLQKFNAIKAAIDGIDPSTSTSDAVVAEAATRAAADASLRSDLDELGSKINERTADITETDYTSQITSGKFLKTNYSIGSTIDVTPSSNGAWGYLIVPVEEGQTARVKGQSGDSPRLWAFTDESYKLLSVESANYSTANYKELTAPAKGYLIYNCQYASTTYPKGIIVDTIVLVKDRVNALGQRMTSAEGEIDELKYIEKDVTAQYANGYINTGGVSIGAEVDITPTSTGNTTHIIVPVVAGQIVKVKGQGGNSPRLWAFTDTSYNLLSVSSTDLSTTSYIQLTATADGYLIANAITSTTYPKGVVVRVSVKDTVAELSETIEDIVDELNDIGLSVADKIEQSKTFNEIPATSSTGFTFVQGVRYRMTNLGAWFTFSIRETESSTSYNVISANPNRSYDFTAEINANFARVGQASSSATFKIERLDTVISRLDALEDINPKLLYQFGKACNCRFSAPTIPALVLPADRLAYFYGLYDSLVSAYPNYVTKVDCDAECVAVGIERPSYMADYPIYMYKFIPSYTPNTSARNNYNTAADRLKVYIVSGTHPEYMGMWDLYHTMRLICEQWESDDNLDELRWNCEFYIIPCSGSWGVQNSSRTNYNGVDLNRNAPSSNWQKTTEGTTTWSGDEPASEYETKVLVHYMNEIKPNMFVDHHNTYSGTGTSTTEGDNKNLMYITSKFQFCVDMGCAHISQMTRAWKKRFTALFPSNSQDPVTVYGFSQITVEPGTRGWYGCDCGALGFTYESNESCLYQNGEYSTSNRTTNTSEISTMATDGFVNFLLRVLKTYSEYYKG